MKVLLITAYRQFIAYPPLGLGYLASYLRQNGFECTILDCQVEAAGQVETVGCVPLYGMNDAQAKERLAAIRPDIIGITSNFTAYHEDTLRMARLCKEVFPHVPVVMGGAHPSMEDEECVMEPHVDFIVRGEGEETLLELVKTLEQNGDLSQVAGITYKSGGVAHKNPSRPQIRDLDSLPMPAYDMMRMDLYLKDQLKAIPFTKNTPAGFIFTSRGCPFRCTFCSTAENWQKFRYRSANNVVDEIEHLVKNFGVKEIFVLDDSFVAKKSRVIEICKEILRRGLKISWQLNSGAQVWILNRELLSHMAQSGLYKMSLPIETASKRMLKYINKPVNLEQAHDIIRICNELGIWSFANFIIGFPEETKEEIEDTVRFINESDLDLAIVFIAQPLAGSKISDDFRRLGLLPNNRIAYDSTFWSTKYDTVHMKADELNRKRLEIISGFTKRRIKRMFSWRGLRYSLLPKINTFDKLYYFISVSLHIARMSMAKKKFQIMPPIID